MKGLLNQGATTVLERLGYSPQRSRDVKREAWWWLSARARAVRGHRLFAGHAVVWTHPGRCELVPIEEAGPGPDEVTVEIATSVVSTGTERAVYAGLVRDLPRYPFRPGYSAAGVVVAAGRRAGVPIGARVAVAAPHASVATVRAIAAYPVPDGVSLADAAFVQLGIISRHGVSLAGIGAGLPVCVLGAGVIGALSLRLAVAAGAEPVIAVARTRRGEAAARAGGASAFVALADDGDLREIGARVVIDATGDPGALAEAALAARDGGRIVLLGSPRGVTQRVPFDLLRAKGLTLVGAHVSTLGRHEADGAHAFRREGLAFLDQLATGAVTVSDLVDEELDPRNASAFYRELPAAGGITAARFDWSHLAERERFRRGRLLRPPDIRARGIDYGGKPAAPTHPGEAPPDDSLAAASGLLRVALVGCGDIGTQNAAAIAAAPNASLVACLDTAAELADDVARRHGAAVARSLDELLERDDVDAVFLAVPHDLHTPLAVQVASSGRHVILEKPLAHTLASAIELAIAAERAGVQVTVCFPHRYEGGVVEARRLIAAGALGELQGTLTTFLADKPPSYWHGGYSGRSSSDWRASRARAGGGILIMNLSHYVDLALHLSGTDVERVTAFVASATPGAEIEDSVSVSIRYVNGAVGTLFGGAAVPGTWEGRTSTELRLWGSAGHVSVEGRREVFSLRGTAGLRAGRWHALPDRASVPPRTAFITRFASAVDREARPDVTLEEALAVQAFVEAAYRSAADGRAVRPADLLGDAWGQARA